MKRNPLALLLASLVAPACVSGPGLVASPGLVEHLNRCPEVGFRADRKAKETLWRHTDNREDAAVQAECFADDAWVAQLRLFSRL